MADFAKLKHVDTEVEGNMLLERLKNSGIPSYVQSLGETRPKIYSGGFSSPNGADIYVNPEDLEKAKMLVESWDNAQVDETALAREAEKSGQIPEDVQQYLDEIQRDKRESMANRLLWSGKTKAISRILSVCMLILFLVFFAISMALNFS
ncbi:MAG: hypothetical protein J1E62_10645 [Lachnospiraceae bacterium]|nr:hypothetical protein [Lachnospiraceae bacterium]